MNLLRFVTIVSSILFITAQELGHCKVKGTVNDPGVKGVIRFIKNDGKIEMIVNVDGITVNKNQQHGIHIHQFGDLTLENGLQTGTHWNPTNTSHACNAERHYGDTGNWDVTEDGTIKSSKVLDLLALRGGKSIIGMAVIIHSQTDDCANTASSGARIGQCVIGIANPTLNNISSNAAEASNVNPNSRQRAVCVLEPTANNDIKDGCFSIKSLVNHQWL